MDHMDHMDLMDLMDLMDDFTFFESILSILSIWSTRRRGCFSTERAAAKINICSSFISGNKTLK